MSVEMKLNIGTTVFEVSELNYKDGYWVFWIARETGTLGVCESVLMGNSDGSSSVLLKAADGRTIRRNAKVKFGQPVRACKVK